MSKKNLDGVSSELYTTEASESKRRAKEEQVVSDPTKEEGERAIAESLIDVPDKNKKVMVPTKVRRHN